MSIEKGVKILINEIHYWKKGPLCTPKKNIKKPSAIKIRSIYK